MGPNVYQLPLDNPNPMTAMVLSTKVNGIMQALIEKHLRECYGHTESA